MPKKVKSKKVIYYKDPLNDDFAGTKIKQVKVDENFKFIHKNFFFKICSFILYYIFVFPLIYIFERLILRVKIVNKKSLKQVKKQNIFLYGNHTSAVDAYTPNILAFPKRNRIIVNPDAVSIKGIRTLVQMLGALPLPSQTSGMRKFLSAVEYYHKKGHITIYPEAHIWPYYTGVRPFTSSSFKYPVKFNAPVVAFFVAYTKPKGFLSFMRKANVTVYISDVFVPNPELNQKDAQQELRDKVYDFMVEKSKLSDYEVIEYKQIEEETDSQSEKE
ncbi:MAG: hypothetical protein J5689_01100 [Clostridia bacterium]|nr:hypothetical protein [Clostridia bacterium]